jgi:hypothetical protein
VALIIHGESVAKSPLPPYVPYRTFTTFIESLKVGIPSHIDKSVMTSYSGGMQSWLKASLRTMKLIDGDGVPQDRLRKLVGAEGEDRKAILRELFNATYAPIMKGKVDLQTTTPQKLRTAFVELGAQGETVEKCMAFLVAMGKDAGFTLSPHLTMRASPKPRTRRSPSVKGVPAASGISGNDDTSESGNFSSDAVTQALLDKFPKFDPSWPSEVQAKWFDAFDRLMKATIKL